MSGSIDNDKQIAKEITLAVIPHLRLNIGASTAPEEANKKVAERVSTFYETIYNVIKKD